jgi:hypothetical protein
MRGGVAWLLSKELQAGELLCGRKWQAGTGWCSSQVTNYEVLLVVP